MKRRDLEHQLAEYGWRFLRHGGQHDIWTDGEREEAIPRHREINEKLARAILRRAMKENHEI
jgi:mRNA interferase HicA